MKLNRALFVFLLTAILVSSSSTIVYAYKNKSFSVAVGIDQHNLFVISLPFVFRVEANDRPPPLNQSTRTQIYNFVRNNPGVQFRGICSGLNLSIGVAQYHLGLLTKAGLLSIFRDGRYKRYFKSNKFEEGDDDNFSSQTPNRKKNPFSSIGKTLFVAH